MCYIVLLPNEAIHQRQEMCAILSNVHLVRISSLRPPPPYMPINKANARKSITILI